VRISIRIIRAALVLLAVRVLGDESDFFASDRIAEIEIAISSEGIKSLQSQPRENVAAQVRCLGQSFTNATLHLKGHGSFQPITDKPSFNCRLGNKNLFGHNRVLLNNSAQDLSFLKWKLASELFLQNGVPAARVNFAQVKLNGRDLGLYLLVEPTDKVFLKHHFKSAKGNLYEGSNTDVADHLEQDNGSPGQNQADLKALADACWEKNLSARWRRLQEVLNVDRFLSFMALEVLVCHHDGYSMDRNNFRLYHDPDTDRFLFIPHGLDLIFDQPQLPMETRFSGMVAHALFETPQGREAYRKRVRELGQKVYGDRALLDRAQQLFELIKTAAPTSGSHNLELRTSINARREFILSQLKGN
jgi:spore coat protein H